MSDLGCAPLLRCPGSSSCAVKAEGIPPYIAKKSIILKMMRKIKKLHQTGKLKNNKYFFHCWPQPHEGLIFPAKRGRWMQTNKQIINKSGCYIK